MMNNEENGDNKRIFAALSSGKRISKSAGICQHRVGKIAGGLPMLLRAGAFAHLFAICVGGVR